jgi:dihydrofolate synthase/folylpolyglutamate synthase
MSTLAPGNPGQDLRAYFLGLTLHGVKLGLQNVESMLKAAGNPQNHYPTVHVAGTNGKGSVLAILKSIFVAAGYETGRFTSPHLIDLSERFQVNGDPIPEEALQENIAFFKNVAEHMPQCPTFFEMNTAVAFRWFEQAQVDVALIEVGMGGRLDSTNVIHPEVTAITNIALEHTAHLGDTVEKIAFEKAGILKHRVPLVLGETRPGPRDVILKRAEEEDCPVLALETDFNFALDGDPWDQHFSYDGPGLTLDAVPLGLAGRYQGPNAAVAVTLALGLQKKFPKLDRAAILRGLANACWPCRMERVLQDPPVLIDVAHNVAGIQHMLQSVGKCITIVAVSSDKDVGPMLEALAPHAPHLILTKFDGKRALPLKDLCRCAAGYPYETAETISEAISRGLLLATRDTPLLITGSIYTAGEARQILIDDHGAAPLRF